MIESTGRADLTAGDQRRRPVLRLRRRACSSSSALATAVLGAKKRRKFGLTQSRQGPAGWCCRWGGEANDPLALRRGRAHPGCPRRSAWLTSSTFTTLVVAATASTTASLSRVPPGTPHCGSRHYALTFDRCRACHAFQSLSALLARPDNFGTSAMTGGLSGGSSMSASNNPAAPARRSIMSKGASATTASSNAVRVSRRRWLRSKGVSAAPASASRVCLLISRYRRHAVLFENPHAATPPVGYRLQAHRRSDRQAWQARKRCQLSRTTPPRRGALAFDEPTGFTAVRHIGPPCPAYPRRASRKTWRRRRKLWIPRLWSGISKTEPDRHIGGIRTRTISSLSIIPCRQ